MPSLDPSTVLNASVPASAMPLISPDALLHAHLKQSPPRRPSNRLTSEPRPIQLNVGSLTHCNGSSLVKIGATTIVCGVRAEILPTSEIPSFRVTKSADKDWTLPSRPKNEVDDHEGEGEYSATQLYNLVVPNIELATGCSPRHPANTAPSVEAQSISQRLLSLLHTSQLVRTSDLEIIYAPPPESQDLELGIDAEAQLKAYWTLYIDMMCISHGGSVFDAAWLALDAALRNCLLPKAWWDADLEKVICSMDVKEARKLRLRGMPVPSSWGLFVPEKRLLTMQNDGEDRSWILMDLDTFEEESCAEVGCITVDCSNGADSAVVLRIEKSGGSVVGVDQIAQVAESAKQRWQQWKNVLDTALTA
ncbi:3' exoribonuclease family, domain-containing protein isoform 1 [Cladophialophora immunda]|nr:3' exoribonuclease family, domain-containing protein isoform 1 [Cladophialophora immunda]